MPYSKSNKQIQNSAFKMKKSPLKKFFGGEDNIGGVITNLLDPGGFFGGGGLGIAGKKSGKKFKGKKSL